MDTDPKQRARLIVIDRIMMEQGILSGEHLNIIANVTEFEQDGPNWKAQVVTNAHTDKTYTVFYNAETDQCRVDIFTKSSHFWVDNPNGPPADDPQALQPEREYFGVPEH
jgi:hypothetical protein